MKMSLFNIEIYLKKCHFHKRANAFYEADCCFSKNSSYKNLSDRL